MQVLRLDAEPVPTTANPFHVPPLRDTLFVKCKMVAVGLTLFPVRMVVFGLSVGFGLLCAAVATIGVDHRAEQVPSPMRRTLLQPLRLCARGILWSCGFWWIRVEYRPGSAAGKSRILVGAPHYSLLDAVVMCWLEMPCSISKSAVAKMPVFGKAAIALQSIFVDRKDPDSKHKCVAAIKQRATEPGWPPLLVFPEGTCTNGKVRVSWQTWRLHVAALCPHHHLSLHTTTDSASAGPHFIQTGSFPAGRAGAACRTSLPVQQQFRVLCLTRL